MPYEIAIVNPRGVKKMAKRKSRKGKMPAGLKRYWAEQRRKKNPRKKHAKVTAHKRRRRSAAKVVHHKRRANPRRHVVHSRRRRRHNPRFSLSAVKDIAMPALLGAGGAIALDVALGYVPLPVMLQTGMPKQGVRVAAALALGFVASKVIGKQKGAQLTSGALTIIAYDVLKGLAHKFAPTLPGLAGDYEEAELGYLNPAALVDQGAGAYMDGVGAYMNDGVGAYMDGDGIGAYMDGMDDM